MNTVETIEGEATEIMPAQAKNASLAVWTPTFAVAIDDAVARVEAKNEFFKRVMKPDQHYGIIPGTSRKNEKGEETAKPTLLKPGAELLLANMGLQAEFSDSDVPTIDYGDDDREGMVRYRRICRIFRQIGPTEIERMQVAKAEGACSSREAKYRWRKDKLVCPNCGKATIIKAKDFSGQNRDLGWICWKKEGKSDGCGTSYSPGDPTIKGQVTGQRPNPDLADVENTILKMADKRALVAATLIATGCSDIFTQDMEDAADDDPPAGTPKNVTPAKDGKTTQVREQLRTKAAAPDPSVARAANSSGSNAAKSEGSRDTGTSSAAPASATPTEDGEVPFFAPAKMTRAEGDKIVADAQAHGYTQEQWEAFLKHHGVAKWSVHEVTQAQAIAMQSELDNENKPMQTAEEDPF